jgi:hypothetical protein
MRRVTAPPEVRWVEQGHRAVYGLAGQFLRTVGPQSEACEPALLFHLLAMIGSAIGRNAHVQIGGTRHAANIFLLIVGATSIGRKGVAAGDALQIMSTADPEWRNKRQARGMSSGEGLIAAVRDSVFKKHPIRTDGRITGYEDVVDIAGVEDKRLFVLESEFASTLQVLRREGNTLSPVIREAWDGDTLQSLTKNATTATDAHVTIVGHITKDEFEDNIDYLGIANGFLNRFLLVHAERVRSLPFGGNPDPLAVKELGVALKEAISWGKQAGRICFATDATEFWAKHYDSIEFGDETTASKLLARAAPYMLRLALLYAVLDRSSLITRHHLEAAWDLVDYAWHSAQYVFGVTTGNPVADRIAKALNDASQGLTRTEISALFGRNKAKRVIDNALQKLLKQGLAIPDDSRRGAEVWVACG